MELPLNLHTQYITNDKNERVSVIIPINEFEQMIEDFEDLQIVAQRKDEESISHQDILKELKQDGII